MKYKKEKVLTPNMFFDWASKNNVDFVVLDYLNNAAEYYPTRQTLQIGNYRQVYLDEQFGVYLVKSDF